MSQAILSPSDYAGTVVAVPPIALDRNGAVAVDANRRLMTHIADGGVATLLYGGNANIYHFGADLFRQSLSVLFQNCPASARILFSVGPDFGKAMDQVRDLRDAGVNNVMLLPMAFPSDPRGVAEGARRIADALGAPIVLYIKRDAYIEADALARLIEDGAVGFVKYAVERPVPGNDAYLDSIIDAAGKDKVASGMGETPIGDHIGRRALATFTSGAVCIAPAACNELLHLSRDGRLDDAKMLSAPFLEFERERARLGGTAVLHDAVTLAGIADCGPLTPLVSNLTEAAKAQILPSVEALVAAETAARGRRKAA